MIDLISKEGLMRFYGKLPIEYNDYLKWLDDECIDINYHYLSTENITTRNKNEWNKKGREIYELDKLMEHADRIRELIKMLETKSFIAQHEYSPSAWFPRIIVENAQIEDKLSFVKSINSSIDIYEFDGGFKIENQLNEFIKKFIDYPYLLKYKNIDIISLDIDLIIKIGSHLSIDFICKNRALIDRIIGFCEKSNLHYILGV